MLNASGQVGRHLVKSRAGFQALETPQQMLCAPILYFLLGVVGGLWRISEVQNIA